MMQQLYIYQNLFGIFIQDPRKKLAIFRFSKKAFLNIMFDIQKVETFFCTKMMHVTNYFVILNIRYNMEKDFLMKNNEAQIIGFIIRLSKSCYQYY